MRFVVLFLLALSNTALAEKPKEAKSSAEIRTFPWELVIDRGKINGCIYDNKFYSSGSILIEETFPRKCKIDPNRDGYWAELDERELELFEASVKTQQRLEAESINIGGSAITKYEAAMVRMMRKSSQR